MTTTIKEKELKKKAKKIEEKIKEGATGLVGFVGDHIPEFVGGAMFIGGIIGLAKLSQRSKAFEDAWRLANNYMKNNDFDHDFGPYKLMKVFEPKTGEFLGQFACHEDTANIYLSLK